MVAFHGAGEGADPSPHDYALDLTLNGDILPDESKVATSDRSITLIIQKKEDGHWPRLLAAAGKPPPNVKVDWDKWVDSVRSCCRRGCFGGSGMSGRECVGRCGVGACPPALRRPRRCHLLARKPPPTLSFPTLPARPPILSFPTPPARLCRTPVLASNPA